MSKRTRAGKALTEMILETFQLNGALLAAGDALTKPFGLTSARWQVIGVVHYEDRPMTVSQIARRMGLARQGVQRIVNDLEKLNMVVLEENIDHQRAKLVTLTPKGRKTLGAVDEAQIAWVNQLSDGLTEKQISQATQLMTRLIRQAEDHPPV